MPLLRKPVLKPIVGLNYMDPSTMLDDRGGFPSNIRLSRNDLKKREGYQAFGELEIKGGPVLHLCQYELESQTIRIIRLSKLKAEKYNSTTGVWDDITGTDFTGGVGEYFSTVVAENKLLISNYVDPMRVYNDAGTTEDLVASSGTVPKAKHLEYNNGYLVAAYTTEGGDAKPTKVQWTDTGDITDWGSGNYGAKLLNEDPLPIRGLKNLNEYSVCYKKNSIYLGRPVDTSDIWKWDLSYTGVGLASGNSIVDYQGKHYFMGNDDFYIFNGVAAQSIGINSVQREVFSRIDTSKLNRCHALLAIDYDEVWFFIITSGREYPTEIWKYNYRTGFWYFDTCDNMSASGFYYAQSSLSWDLVPGKWRDQTWRWDDKLTVSESPVLLMGDSNGYTVELSALINNDRGAAIDGKWESGDFSADKFEEYKRWLQLDFEAKGNEVTVEYSTDYGENWSSIKTQTLEVGWQQYRVYFDIVARTIRFRFRNNNLGETFYLRQFYPYWLDREEVGR